MSPDGAQTYQMALALVSDVKPVAEVKKRLGTLLVLVVVCLYVGSGVMIQILFGEMGFEKVSPIPPPSLSLLTLDAVHPTIAHTHPRLAPCRSLVSAFLFLVHFRRPLLFVSPTTCIAQHEKLFDATCSCIQQSLAASADIRVGISPASFAPSFAPCTLILLPELHVLLLA